MCEIEFETTIKLESPFIKPQNKNLFSPIFLKNFEIKENINEGRLYITGLGLYQAFLNNQKIGNAYLTPGFNDYDYYFVRRDAARRIGLTQTTTTSPIRRPERIVKGIEKLFDVIDRYSVHPAQYLKILKKLFSYQLGQAFIQINAHAMQWPDQYQDAGIVYKKQVWERVQRYYTPELNAIMSIPAAIRCDYTQKEVFDESEIGVLAFCKPVKMNSLKLFKQKSNTFRKAKRLPELEVLSEITWDRLYKISCEAAVFCVIDVVCKESNKIVVKGTYKYPLLITEKPEIFPALQCGDTLITAESVSFNEDFWGEPWQGCGRWQAAFSNLEQADIAEPVFKLGFCFYHDKE